MLTAHHINKSYVIQPILQDISLSISNSERVGLIGPNGAGKTSLMRILAGQEQPDSGTVLWTRSNLRIGYLAQGMMFDEDQTIQTTLRPAQGRPEPFDGRQAQDERKRSALHRSRSALRYTDSSARIITAAARTRPGSRLPPGLPRCRTKRSAPHARQSLDPATPSWSIRRRPG